MQKTKQTANQIKKPANPWDLERYLTQRRKDSDSKYDFRSSRLERVFGRLLCEGRVREDKLRGLRENKVEAM